MRGNSVKSASEILPTVILDLDKKVEGGIPEPHRSEIFGVVGLDPSKKQEKKE